MTLLHWGLPKEIFTASRHFRRSIITLFAYDIRMETLVVVGWKANLDLVVATKKRNAVAAAANRAKKKQKKK